MMRVPLSIGLSSTKAKASGLSAFRPRNRMSPGPYEGGALVVKAMVLASDTPAKALPLASRTALASTVT